MTEPAEMDLIDIINYIALELRAPSTAQKFLTKISKPIFELEQMPKKYPLVNDERLSSQGIRKLVVDNYIVFYTISETIYSVIIIRILYGKRNWSYLL